MVEPKSAEDVERRISPGDILRCKEPWELQVDTTTRGTGEESVLDRSLLLKFGPHCDLRVVYSDDKVITCRAFEVNNKMLRAYITVDLEAAHLAWDKFKLIKRGNRYA